MMSLEKFYWVIDSKKYTGSVKIYSNLKILEILWKGPNDKSLGEK